MKKSSLRVVYGIMIAALLLIPLNFVLADSGVYDKLPGSTSSSTSGNNLSSNSASGNGASEDSLTSSSTSSVTTSSSEPSENSASSSTTTSSSSEASSSSSSEQISSSSASTSSSSSYTSEDAGTYVEETSSETSTVVSFNGFSKTDFNVVSPDSIDIDEYGDITLTVTEVSSCSLEDVKSMLPSKATAYVVKVKTTTSKSYTLSDNLTESDIRGLSDDAKAALNPSVSTSSTSENGIKTFHIGWTAAPEFTEGEDCTYYFTAAVSDNDSAYYTFADGSTEVLDKGVTVVTGEGSQQLMSMSLMATPMLGGTQTTTYTTLHGLEYTYDPAGSVMSSYAMNGTLYKVKADGKAIFIDAEATANGNKTVILCKNEAGNFVAQNLVTEADTYGGYDLSIVSIYGGSEGNNLSGGTSITMLGGTVGFIYGGSLGGTIGSDTYVKILGGTVNGNIIGGNNSQGAEVNNCYMTLSGNTYIGGSVICGSYMGTVKGDVKADIKDGVTIHGTIYGASATCDINGTLTINVSTTTVTGGVIIGNNFVSPYDKYTINKAVLNVNNSVISGVGVCGFPYGGSDSYDDWEAGGDYRKISNEEINIVNSTVHGPVYFDNEPCNGSSTCPGLVKTGTITIDGSTVEGLVNGDGRNCIEIGNNPDKVCGKLVLKNKAVVTGGIQMYSFRSVPISATVAPNISYDGTVTADSGAIKVISDTGSEGYPLITINDTSGSTNITDAFNVIYSNVTQKLMADYDKNAICIRSGEQILLYVNKDGVPYSGLTGLTFKNESGTTSYTFKELKNGIYYTYVHESGDHYVWNGITNTGLKLITTGNGSAQGITLNYYTLGIRITGADGTSNRVIVNGTPYYTASSDLILQEGTDLTISANTASEEYKMTYYRDTADLNTHTIDTDGNRISQYTGTCVSERELTAKFEKRKADISIDPVQVDFGEKTAGYTAFSGKEITVTNSGTADANIVMPTSASYNFIGFKNGYLPVAKGGGTATFTVSANKGLSAGNYDTAFSLKSKIFSNDPVDSEAVLSAKFTVNKAFGVSIISTDADNSIVNGESVTLTVSRNGVGTGNLTYQWKSSNSSETISGITSDSITVKPKSATTYTLTATDESGVSASASLKLYVVANKLGLTVTPDPVDFGSIIETDVLPSKTVTIKNTGNTPVSVNSALSGSTNYVMNFSGSSTIEAGSSITVVMKPKIKAAAAGSSTKYDATVTISANALYGDVGTIAKTVDVKYSVYSKTAGLLKMSTDVLDFGSVTEGYDQTYAMSINKEFTVTYTGEATCGVKTLQNPNFDDFTVSSPTGSWPVSISVNQTLTFQAYPKTGLKGNIYVDDFSKGWPIDDTNYLGTSGFAMCLTVNDPLSMTLDNADDDILYLGEGAALTANITGGTTPFTYTWYCDDAVVTGSGKTYSAAPTTEGTYVYKVMVKDSSGMTATSSRTIKILSTDGAITVNPYAVDFTGLSAGYTKLPEAVTITVTNNKEAKMKLKFTNTDYYTYTGLNSLTMTVSGNSSKTFTIQPKKGRKAGTYSDSIDLMHYVDSATMATVKSNMVVADAPEVTLADSKIINGGSTKLKATVTGGIAPYTYKWSTGASENSITVSPTVDTTYMLTVTDSSGTEVVKQPTVYVYSVNLSVTPASLDFGSVIYGYTTAPAAQSLKITNSGTGPCTIQVPDTPDSFTITGLTADTELDAGDSLTVKVRPNTGLAAGTKSENVVFNTDTEGLSVSANATIKVIAVDETIAVSPSTLDFGSVTEGYTTIPAAKSVTVTNNGNASITIKKPTVSKYTVTGFDSDRTLAKGASFTFSVAPKKSLAAGDQKETISLETSGGKTAAFTTAFTVVKVPQVTVTGAMKVEPGLSTTLTANVTGGTAPYTYKWSTNGTSDAIKVSPTETTEYTVKVTDASGITASAKAKVVVTDKLSVQIDGISMVNEGSSATLTAIVTDGTAPYTYKWSTGSSESSIDVTPAEQTSYSVTVTDSLGATAADSKTVKVSKRTETVEPDYSIAASSPAVNFGSQSEGYSAESLTKAVTITNNGNSNVTLKVPNSNYYTFDMTEDKVIGPGDSVNVNVTPKGFLDQGTYDETITFKTSQGSSVEVKGEFSVEASASANTGLTNETIFQSKGYDYGNGNVQLEVENPENADIIGISKTADCIDAALTDEEKQMVQNGADVKLKLTTKLLTADEVSSKDKALTDQMIEQYKASYPDYALLTFLDISLEKQVNGGKWEKVSSTPEPLELEIGLTDEMKALGKELYLLRVHDGVCSQIAKWDPNNKRLVFTTKLFSTYAVTCIPVNDAAAATINEEQTKKDSGFDWWLVAIIAIFGIFEVFVWPLHHRRRNEVIASGSAALVCIVICAAFGRSATDIIAASMAAALILVTVVGNVMRKKKVRVTDRREG